MRQVRICLQIHALDVRPELSCFQFFKRYGRGLCMYYELGLLRAREFVRIYCLVSLDGVYKARKFQENL